MVDTRNKESSTPRSCTLSAPIEAGRGIASSTSFRAVNIDVPPMPSAIPLVSLLKSSQFPEFGVGVLGELRENRSLREILESALAVTETLEEFEAAGSVERDVPSGP